MPPHLRNGAPQIVHPAYHQPPGHLVRNNNRNAPYNAIHGSRQYNDNYGSRPHNDNNFDMRNEFARLKGENMHLSQQLAAERAAKHALRKDIEEEMKQIAFNSYQSMLVAIFGEKMEVDKKRAQLEQRVGDLKYREAKIAQAEIFLSVGQRALWEKKRKLMAQDGHGEDDSATYDPMAYMHREKIRMALKDSEIEAEKKYQDAHRRLSAKFEELEIKEQRLNMLAENLMIHCREQIEAGMRVGIEEEFAIMEEKIKDRHWKQGFEAGIGEKYAEDLKKAYEKGIAAAQGHSAKVGELIPDDVAGDISNGGQPNGGQPDVPSLMDF